MTRFAAIVSGVAIAGALLTPGPATAELRPHRAEYTLRLGTALNATRIGTVVQDIARECDGWRIRRDFTVDVSLTPSFRVRVTSRMEGEEQRGGGFTWRAVQAVNGAERDVHGTVRKGPETYKVEVATPEGPGQSVLPPLTLMPVATMSHLVDRLKSGTETFPMLILGAEADGDTFRIDVKRSAAAAPGATPPSQRRVEVPGSQYWPLTMVVTRAAAPDGKPILSARGRLFESGVLDGFVVEAGAFTVAAHLQGLEMREAPHCP